MSGKAINDLTGAPYENMDVHYKTGMRVLEKLKNGLKNNYMMTCASKVPKKGRNPNEITVDKNGIIAAHCYAILDVRDTSKK